MKTILSFLFPRRAAADLSRKQRLVLLALLQGGRRI